MMLVERDEELGDLVRCWEETRRGTGHVVLVSGTIGSGKTALLHTFTQQLVQSGAAVLSGVGSRAERALPFGVVRQLFRHIELADDHRDRIVRQIENGALTAALHPSEDEHAAEVLAPVMHGLCTELLDLSLLGPLAIVVDDVHACDAASLLCLLSVARRANTARVLLVLGDGSRTRPARPSLHTDLLRQPHCHERRLSLLSVDGVRQVLAQDRSAEVAARLAVDAHAVSGGNPLLVRGIATDNHVHCLPDGRLVVGEAFVESVLTCLYRGDPSTLRVARALAVLGGPVPARILGALANVGEDIAAEEIATLTRAGLLRGGWFRHQAVHEGVLDRLAAEEGPTMHARAAVLRHDEGAPAPVVARHLAVADRLDRPWVATTLREAAEQALARNEVDEALRYLRLADGVSTDGPLHADIKALLTCVEWRLDPVAASRHHPDLVGAHRAGHLSSPLAVLMIEQLLWRGAFDEATERIGDHPGGRDPEQPSAFGTTQMRWRYAYPELPGRTLAAGGQEDPASRADRLLRESTLNDFTIGPILFAVRVLMYSDHLDEATAWCNELMQESIASRAPLWQALFTGLLATASERRGELARAENLARSALSMASHSAWGVAIGVPLAGLVTAATAQGRYDEAASHLKVPVPPAMFRTAYALPYLQARGRFYLSTQRLDAAMAEFQRCGELMRLWDLDLSMVVAWRTDAATVHVRLGERQAARALVEEQLAVLRPRHRRVRAISLRVLAAASQPAHRPALLREAARALHVCGDRLELAYTLADLADVHRIQGEHAQSRALAARALELARQCGAVPLQQRLAPLVGTDTATGDGSQAPPAADKLLELSDAQRRVAALAAIGLSNREIADRLFVTVSTVEQHLTRVYRKLKVNRRTMLPMDFDVTTDPQRTPTT